MLEEYKKFIWGKYDENYDVAYKLYILLGTLLVEHTPSKFNPKAKPSWTAQPQEIRIMTRQPVLLKSVSWSGGRWSGSGPPVKQEKREPFLRQKEHVLFCAVPEIFSSFEIFVADRNEQDGEGREEDAGGLSCPNQLAEDLLRFSF